MVILGCASDVDAQRISPRPERFAPQELEGLVGSPEPEEYVVALARTDRSFSDRMLAHGMVRDSTLFASSEKRRRVARCQERRSRRISELSALFERDARRVARFQAKLAARQRARVSDLAGFSGASIIQTRWRMRRAQLELRHRRRYRAGRFVSDVLAFRARRREVRNAANALQRSFARIMRRHAARVTARLNRSAISVQRAWRGARARMQRSQALAIAATTRSLVESVVVYGSARAQQVLMGPHYAANLIQSRYRRRLRRRRAAERRYRRARGVGRLGAYAALKKIADASRGTRHFAMPSTDALQRHRGARIIMQEGQLLKNPARFVATTKGYDDAGSLARAAPPNSGLSTPSSRDTYAEADYDDDDDDDDGFASSRTESDARSHSDAGPRNSNNHQGKMRKQAGDATFVTTPTPPDAKPRGGSNNRRRRRRRQVGGGGVATFSHRHFVLPTEEDSTR